MFHGELFILVDRIVMFDGELHCWHLYIVCFIYLFWLIS